MEHCVKAIYAEGLPPLVRIVALDAIHCIALGLNENGPEAADSLLYGAHLSGMVMAQSGMAFHHKLCHVLGGFGLPHSEMHAVPLPHAMAYNNSAAPTALKAVAGAIGAADAADAAGGMWDLADLWRADAVARYRVRIRRHPRGRRSGDCRAVPQTVAYGPRVQLLPPLRLPATEIARHDRPSTIRNRDDL